MPVLDHLRELRRRVIIILIIVAAGALIAYQFYDQILSFLVKPYCAIPVARRTTNINGDCTLSILGPADGFIARLKICVIAGTVFTAPFWLYQVWAFVTPGLRKNERRYTVIFVVTATLLFLIGMALAYAVLFTGLKVLINQSGSSIQATLEINKYLSFLTLLMIAFGSAFELPLLIVMLNIVRVLPYRFLKKAQRVSIFLIFVFAGVATPTPDPFTMCAMAVPMVLLFEGAVLFAKVHDQRLAQRQAAEAQMQPPDDMPSAIDPHPSPLADDSWTSLP